MSRAHPGTSSRYLEKIRVRLLRLDERRKLELAKAWYLENMEGDMKKDRQTVTKIKKDLMAGKQLVKANYQKRKIKNEVSLDMLFKQS